MGSTNAPAWWRSAFDTPSVKVALNLDLTGMTKGQVYINGHALGRYFVATKDTKPIEPTMTMAIPSAWLNADAANELTIFDEHGASPAKLRVVVERL